MSTSPSIGLVAFAVDRHGERSEEIDAAPPVRGASVVKPLLVWVGAGVEPFASDRERWEAIGRPAVTVSDNEATAVLWSTAGGEHLLTELTDRAGVAWSPAGDGEHPALRLMVTAGELARAYLRLASHERRRRQSWPTPPTTASREGSARLQAGRSLTPTRERRPQSVAEMLPIAEPRGSFSVIE